MSLSPKQFVKTLLPKSLVTLKLPRNASNHVLLTFDDGPNPELTPLVLDRLRKYNAKAIFFLPGRRIQRAPYLLPMIIKEGHLLGNHTYSHINNNDTLTYKQYYDDLVKCQILIKKYIGNAPIYFRPSNGVISIRNLVVPRYLRLKTVLWSLDVNDWKCKNSLDGKNAIDLIKCNVQERDIILFHDSNTYIIDILDGILSYLKYKDYDLKNGINYL